MKKSIHSLCFIIFFILLVGCLGQVSSDIYAPALPAIAHYFQVHVRYAQWSMALYMVGISTCVLVYGPISDAIGRKKPLIAGLIIALVGTLLCFFAPNVTILLIGRLIQGCGVGACSGLWRSIFRDVFSGDDLAKYGSYFSIILIFVIPAAPTLGGYLQEYIGWRAIFGFLILYIVIALYVVSVHYRETSQHHHISHIKPRFALQTLGCIITNPIFMGYSICVLLTYGAFFAWFTIGPVLLIKFAHINPSTFGWLNLISASTAMLLGGLINARFVKHYGTHVMLQIGWGCMLLSALSLLAVYTLFGMTVIGIMLCMFLFYFGVVFIWPNAFANAMMPVGKLAGYAGAFYSAMQLGGGALLGAVATHLPANTPVPFACIVIVCAVSAWLLCCYLAYPAMKQFLEKEKT